MQPAGPTVKAGHRKRVLPPEFSASVFFPFPPVWDQSTQSQSQYQKIQVSSGTSPVVQTHWVPNDMGLSLWYFRRLIQFQEYRSHSITVASVTSSVNRLLRDVRPWSVVPWRGFWFFVSAWVSVGLPSCLDHVFPIVLSIPQLYLLVSHHTDSFISFVCISLFLDLINKNNDTQKSRMVSNFFLSLLLNPPPNQFSRYD